MPKLHSKLDQQKRQALIRLFGTTSWEDVFYPKPIKMRTLDGDAYEKYTKERLETIFGAVLDPLRLPRTKGPARYLLFLCVSSRNPRAQEIATRIGNYILKSGISS